MRYEEISAFKVAVSVKVARMPVQNWSQVQNQMWRQQSKILKFYLYLTWRGLRVASSGHGWWFGDLLRHTENSRRELASSGTCPGRRDTVWLTWQVEYLDLEGEVKVRVASQVQR